MVGHGTRPNGEGFLLADGSLVGRNSQQELQLIPNSQVKECAYLHATVAHVVLLLAL